MKTLLKGALVASLLIGTVSVGNAAIGVAFDVGNVAVGYSDGYYDGGHHWHRWAHPGDRDAYRGAHSDGFHDWGHNDKHHH